VVAVPSQPPSATPSPRSFASLRMTFARRRLAAAGRWALTLAVLFATGRQIAQLLAAAGALRLECRAGWAALAVLLYVLGMCLFARFWQFCLRDMSGKAVTYGAAFAAYWPSQLAKYVPGKIWVAVVRCTILSPSIRPFATAAAAAYETLAVMAVGAAMALAMLGLFVPQCPPALLALSFALMLGLGALMTARVFSRLLKLVAPLFRDPWSRALPTCRTGTVAKGIVLIALGWCLVGGATWAVTRAAGIADAPLRLWPALTGATALATVGGVVAFVVPAGLGVREYLITQSVGSTLGAPEAAVVAVGARLVSIAGEAIVTLGCLLWRTIRERSMRVRDASPSSSPSSTK